MRIAIIGTGISGLTAAYLLNPLHELTLFEAADYVGGHSNTCDVTIDGRTIPVDTGFIVCNDRTYPNFLRLLAKIGVECQPSDMSFSVQCAKTGLEYNGNSLNQLFAQRSNLFRPRFYGMLRDILRFRKMAYDWSEVKESETLAGFLDRGRFGSMFIQKFIVPMGAAIWSADPKLLLEEFPAKFFLRFFANHGFLDDDRPMWKTVVGGSREYVRALNAGFRDRIRLKTPVTKIHRRDDGVQVDFAGGSETFDRVVLASHSDQSLAMLAEPSDDEREVLSSLAYQPNDAVLHTDRRMLPERKAAWASWNYFIPSADSQTVAVTYYMNLLQRLPTSTPVCVTLNRTQDIDPAKIVRRIQYHHPVFTRAGSAGQLRWNEISGVRRTHYCGAYWGNGFHEDGVNSGIAAARQLGATW